MFEYNYGKHVEFDVRAGNFFRFYVKSVPFLVFFSANIDKKKLVACYCLKASTKIHRV